MIKRLRDCFERIANSNEIDHVLVLVKGSLYRGRYPIVVSMEAFANVASVSDKMGCREDKLFFGNSDLKRVSHDFAHKKREDRISGLPAAVRKARQRSDRRLFPGCVGAHRSGAKSRNPPVGADILQQAR